MAASAETVWNALAALWVVADAGEAPESVRLIAWRVHRMRSEGAPRRRGPARRKPAARKRRRAAERILSANGHVERRRALNRSFGKLHQARPRVFAEAARWLRSDDARAAFIRRQGASNYCTLLADAFDRIERGRKAGDAFGLTGRPSPNVFGWLDDAAAVVMFRWCVVENRQRRRLKATAIDVLEKFGKPLSHMSELYARCWRIRTIKGAGLWRGAAMAGLLFVLPPRYVPDVVDPPRRGALAQDRNACRRTRQSARTASTAPDLAPTALLTFEGRFAPDEQDE